MPMTPGTRLGPYEVSGLIGAGGMGEVYRARDTRLDRTVAIKLLPADLNADADRRARFEREARTIAQLAHPHICTLYDVGSHEGATYLVMEHLTGDTLAARIEKGPLPVAQALAIGAQIADALAAAHKQGIVHRDLKPANVMLVRPPSGPRGRGGPPGPSGAHSPSDSNVPPVPNAPLTPGGRSGRARSDGPSGPSDAPVRSGGSSGPSRGGGPSGAPFVKLLDFGLAKLQAHGERPAVSLGTMTATAAPSLTERGTILGTLPYMAPEQVQGQETDARTDLWALGAILYEMLTGARAFEASSATSLVGAILEREPAPISTRQPLTPPSLERVVRKCLAKHPDDRWDTAHDVADELRWIAQSGAESASLAMPAGARRRRLSRLVAGGLAIALAAGAAGAWLYRRAAPAVNAPTLPVVHAWLDVAPAERLHGGGYWEPGIPTPAGARTALTWTPDGKALVFVGVTGRPTDGQLTRQHRQLYLRPLDSPRARAIPGTDDAHGPVVSPDGRSVAFWSNAAIRKVALAGGPVEELTGTGFLSPPAGMAWAADGTLFFGGSHPEPLTAMPILQVGRDGKMTPATQVANGELRHQSPVLLPGDRVLVFTVCRRLGTWGDEEIVAQVRATGVRKVLLRDATDPRYVASGHLLFLRRGVLFAVPFDPERLEVRGQPVAVLADVAQALVSANGTDQTGAGQFAVSPTGMLAWVSGGIAMPPDATLVAVDRTGRETPLSAPAAQYGAVRVSPDGGRLAVGTSTLFEASASIYDLARGTLAPVVQETQGEVGPTAWTPDGRRLTFNWFTGGRATLVWQPADGSPGRETLETSDVVPPVFPASWSPDGRHLLGVTTRGDIWSLTREGSQLTRRLLLGAYPWHFSPEFSPDGRYMAYDDYSTGGAQVQVQPYPGPGPRVQVSTGGAANAEYGRNPTWNRKGGELFYIVERAEGIRMMAVPISLNGGVTVGHPRQLFEKKGWYGCMHVRCYDVAPDGQRFYFVVPKGPVTSPPVTHIAIVQNWVEELKAKVPSGVGR